MEQLTAYIGRDNEEQLELLQAGTLVTAGSVTRAILRSDSFCVDTDTDPDIIYFVDEDRTVLGIKPGLISELEANKAYRSKLTIFDGLTTIGYAWVTINIRAYAWEICNA